MEKLYVACNLGTRWGRVMLGTLNHGTLMLSELRRFANIPIREKKVFGGEKSVGWDIAQLHQEVMLALRELGAQDTNLRSISCTAWPSDYLLFGSDGALLSPAYHHADPRGAEGFARVQEKIPAGFIYAETGGNCSPTSTLSQLAAESSRRLRRARSLMPVADGFNFLLSGVSSVEMTSASATRLFNPVSRVWSEHLIRSLGLSRELLPLLAHPGMKLGRLRPEIARDTRLEEVQVVASCSNELAAALASLPIESGQEWAYLRIGEETVVGAELSTPLISEVTRKLDYTNDLCFGGSANFYKRVPGLSILNECKRFWLEKDRELSDDVLMHLVTTAPPFESLINPTDPRFATPSDMPLKIQAYCRETDQEVPRKPGPILRCVLESLALHYRHTLQEMEMLTGNAFSRLYVLGAGENSLLNNFIANALQLPVVLAPRDAVPLGNVLVQSLTLGHIQSLAEGREIVRQSFRTQGIIPHPAPWDAAAERLLNLMGHTSEPVTA